MPNYLMNGALSNGTLLFGPTNEAPEGLNYLEVTINGKLLYVGYHSQSSAEELRPEIEAWAQSMVDFEASKKGA